jgi:hypothetical protein
MSEDITPPSPIPESMPVYKISEREPEFPCWLWHEIQQMWAKSKDRFSYPPPTKLNHYGYTHWSPSSLTPPNGRPEDSLEYLKHEENPYWHGNMGKLAGEPTSSPASADLRSVLDEIIAAHGDIFCSVTLTNSLFAALTPLFVAKDQRIAELTKERYDFNGWLKECEDKLTAAETCVVELVKELYEANNCWAMLNSERQRITALETELAAAKQQIAMDTVRFKEMQETGMRLEVQLADAERESAADRKAATLSRRVAAGEITLQQAIDDARSPAQ